MRYPFYGTQKLRNATPAQIQLRAVDTVAPAKVVDTIGGILNRGEGIGMIWEGKQQCDEDNVTRISFV